MRNLRNLADNLAILSMNTATLGFQHSINKVVDAVAEAGFGAIAPWRNEVERDGVNVSKLAKQIESAGLSVSGYVRTAYFSGSNKQQRQLAIEDNKKALNIAAELNANCLVAVVGGMSQDAINKKNMPSLQQSNMACSRDMILDGLLALGETAQSLNMPIAIEPLHPVYAANRSVLNSIAQANEWLKILHESYPKHFSLIVDAYHVWWDPMIDDSIKNATGNIAGFHVSDWLYETEDVLNDRGMMGDGVIDLQHLRHQVEATGYDGYVEVEIFSSKNWWKKPMHETLENSMQRLLNVC